MRKLRITESAADLIEKSVEWWHRVCHVEARDLLQTELKEELDFIVQFPRMKVQVVTDEGRLMYRALMRKSEHHLYYVIEDDGAVTVHAVWSAVRGEGPPGL